MPIIAAYAYRHRKGLPYIYPEPDLSYTANFMNMLWQRSVLKYLAHPVLARALDILFILHADHEQNCSASAMRVVGSSEADPFLATAAAASALAGPLHGGANEAVLNMLGRIGSKDNIPAFVKGVKEGKEKLMGFGHRVYKNYDPRAKHDQAGGRGGLRGHRTQSQNRHRHGVGTDRPQRRVFRFPQAVPERRLLLRASSMKPWASIRRCSPCCSPFRAPPAGWRNGRNW